MGKEQRSTESGFMGDFIPFFLKRYPTPCNFPRTQGPGRVPSQPGAGRLLTAPQPGCGGGQELQQAPGRARAVPVRAPT